MRFRRSVIKDSRLRLDLGAARKYKSLSITEGLRPSAHQAAKPRRARVCPSHAHSQAYDLALDRPSDFIDCAATIFRPTLTASRVRQQRLFVIDRNLFAGGNISQREKQNVAMQRLHVSVGVTGMINVVRAVPAARAVQTEAPVDVADAQVPASARSLSCFHI